MNNYKLTPIGTTESFNEISEIKLYEKYLKGLLHLDKFSHILLFFVNPKNNLFKNNFSNIDIKLIKIDEINFLKGTIKTKESNLNNLVIIDIKPYFPIEDRVINSNYIEDDQLDKDFLAPFSQSKEIFLKRNGTISKLNGKSFLQFNEIDDNLLDFYQNFSHIQIIWWFSRFEDDLYKKTLQCNPPYEKAPRTGIFASRSPVRINPIALTTAKIIKIDKVAKRIYISNIDAFNNTPLIDIRPYIPNLYKIDDFLVPEWLNHWSDSFIEETHTDIVEDFNIFESDYSKLFTKFEVKPNLKENTKKNQEIYFDENNSYITVLGAKENNLKNISVKIPKNKITVLTGPSGSGKSSFAFDTLFAESQRRYLNSISLSGKQLFKHFSKANFDEIKNLPISLALEQKSLSKNIRSNVGTVTEISSYLRLLFSKIGIRHCPKCGRGIEPKSINEICELIISLPEGTNFKLSSKEHYNFFTVPNNSQIKEYSLKIEKYVSYLLKSGNGFLTLEINAKDKFILHNRDHCFYCGISFFELSPSSFSSNNPESICIECNGLGFKLNVDSDLIVESQDKSILDGASLWWGKLRDFIKKPNANWMKGEVIALAQQLNVDLELPWKELPEIFKHKALFGTDDNINLNLQGEDGKKINITKKAEGAINHIKRLSKNSHDKASYEFYKQFMKEEECPSCKGEQLLKEYRYVEIEGIRFPEVISMNIKNLFIWINNLSKAINPDKYFLVEEIIEKIRKKSESLINLNLEYLSLKRSISTLSGGEIQRLKISSQIGCGLNNILYIFDEPSTGLHHTDRLKIINALRELCNTENTVLLVEHNRDIINSADFIIDFGPKAGKEGGHIVAYGTPSQLKENKNSVTGKYLDNIIKHQEINNCSPEKFISIDNVNTHNLKNIDVKFPLNRFICIVGKSGSGKSSLVTDTLAPIIHNYFNKNLLIKGNYGNITGLENLKGIINITQDPIGKSPRSNPATYTGLYDEIRNIFSKTIDAKEKNYKPNRFSFNSSEGCCTECGGEGKKRVEMNYMADIWITCQKCKGKRFNDETLEIKYKNKNISDILNMDINEAKLFFSDNEKIKNILDIFIEVGLGYIQLGQGSNTLSGGEAQRIKLVKELIKSKNEKILYIIDEPSNGLHFTDIENLIKLIKKIVEKDNTVIVVEHNEDIINNADWIIELGYEGGDNGGYLVYSGGNNLSTGE